MKLLPISEVKLNKDNPRIIKDKKYKKLLNSVRDSFEFMNIRPIIIDEDNVVIGGNMRLRVCRELKWKEVPTVVFTREMADSMNDKALEDGRLPKTYEEYCQELLIKDNVGFGEWEFNILANEWEIELLKDWGLDLPKVDIDDTYTTKIESPIYEPRLVKPKEDSLYDLTKYYSLLDEIEKANISEELKEFLRLASTRHIKFNYSKVADYYAHSEREEQTLIENNALVIIDYKKAIDKGFVKLYNTIEDLSNIDG